MVSWAFVGGGHSNKDMRLSERNPRVLSDPGDRGHSCLGYHYTQDV